MPFPVRLGEAPPGQIRGMAGKHRRRAMGEWTAPVAPVLADGLAQARETLRGQLQEEAGEGLLVVAVQPTAECQVVEPGLLHGPSVPQVTDPRVPIAVQRPVHKDGVVELSRGK